MRDRNPGPKGPGFLFGLGRVDQELTLKFNTHTQTHAQTHAKRLYPQPVDKPVENLGPCASHTPTHFRTRIGLIVASATS
jgi:hypothetical protein